MKMKKLSGGDLAMSEDESIIRVRQDLIRRGFHVTPATQYGFHLALYRDSSIHSDYLVEIITGGPVLGGLDLVRSGRLAHSVKKRVLFAIPLNSGKVKYLELRDWDENNA